MPRTSWRIRCATKPRRSRTPSNCAPSSAPYISLAMAERQLYILRFAQMTPQRETEVDCAGWFAPPICNVPVGREQLEHSGVMGERLRCGDAGKICIAESLDRRGGCIHMD